MRTTAEITKDIEQEKKRGSEKAVELQAKQVENRKHLEQANEQYLTALASAADDAEIAILQEQVEAAERTIRLTDDAINALLKGNPRIQALEAERVSLLMYTADDVKKKATAIHQSMKQHHDALAKGVDELNSMYHAWYRATSSANNILEQFSSEQKEKFGLPVLIAEQNPVVALLNSLLIERHRAFRH
ncbi:hypothetical protein [Paenibacillus woosongensis]|uniref:Uncharacterized protein n=1 Tax=Paenibacillus woosongensis TaxID=307580 RepID=A0A7X3CKX0_9BACL|nr:hypothetical protein [Paenibacillus woosongensis]MUG43438.1 hypothetical protein [Paenibacillus woosongensis]